MPWCRMLAERLRASTIRSNEGARMASSLLQQNRWLRDSKTRAKALRISAASSSAVEGIHKPFAADKSPTVTATRKHAKSGG